MVKLFSIHSHQKNVRMLKAKTHWNTKVMKKNYHLQKLPLYFKTLNLLSISIRMHLQVHVTIYSTLTHITYAGTHNFETFPCVQNTTHKKNIKLFSSPLYADYVINVHCSVCNLYNVQPSKELQVPPF